MIVAEITDQELVDHILLLQEELESKGQALDSLKREMEIRLRDRSASEAILDGAKCILKYRGDVARIIEQARIDQGAMIIVTKKDDDMILEEEKAWQHK